MNVALVGNQGNNAYRLCCWMRAQGIDATLYMFQSEHRSERSRPESIDRGIRDKDGEYPEWIRWYGENTKAWFIGWHNDTARDITHKHDVVITSGLWGLLAANQIRNMPIVHLALGPETAIPKWLFGWRTSLKWRVVSAYTRRALQRVDAICNDFAPTMHTFARLGLLGKVSLWSWPEDVLGNRRRVDATLLSELNSRYSEYHRVFLWLSRLNFRDPESDEYKAPEQWLDAFGRIVHHDRQHVRAIVGLHGHDVSEFQHLVELKNLSSHIDFVPHLPYWKLLTHLSISNGVVCDEIGPAIFSGMTRESLCAGAVTIKTYDTNLIKLSYGDECPLLNVHDSDSCYRQMKTACDWSQSEFAQQQRRTADWAEHNLHYPSHVKRLMRIAEETQHMYQYNLRAAS